MITMQSYQGIDPLAIDWVNRCLQNGGTQPSGSIVQAISHFATNLKQTSFYSKLKAVNCFAPHDLVNCRTPLIVGNGLSLWTGSTFAQSDLTVEGLKNTSANKFLSTGCNPSTLFTYTGSVGATIYFTEVGATQGHAWGCTTNSYSSDFVGTVYLPVNNGMHFDCYNTTTGRLFPTGTGTFTGFLSANRVAANDSRFYWRKTGISVAQVGSTLTTGGGTVPNTPHLYLFCSFNGSGAQFYQDYRCSFFSLHDGMTLDELTKYCALIEQMRKEMGGGYVAP